ncbi:hypothetical protein HZS_4613, partial [Henneguya salminicola]
PHLDGYLNFKTELMLQSINKAHPETTKNIEVTSNNEKEMKFISPITGDINSKTVINNVGYYHRNEHLAHSLKRLFQSFNIEQEHNYSNPNLPESSYNPLFQNISTSLTSNSNNICSFFHKNGSNCQNTTEKTFCDEHEMIVKILVTAAKLDSQQISSPVANPIISNAEKDTDTVKNFKERMLQIATEKKNYAEEIGKYFENITTHMTNIKESLSKLEDSLQKHQIIEENSKKLDTKYTSLFLDLINHIEKQNVKQLCINAPLTTPIPLTPSISVIPLVPLTTNRPIAASVPATPPTTLITPIINPFRGTDPFPIAALRPVTTPIRTTTPIKKADIILPCPKPSTTIVDTNISPPIVDKYLSVSSLAVSFFCYIRLMKIIYMLRKNKRVIRKKSIEGKAVSYHQFYDKLFIGTHNGFINGESLSNHNIRSSFTISNLNVISCIQTGRSMHNINLLVAGSLDSNIYFININNGKIYKTIQSLDKSAILSLLIVDQNLYFGTSSGSLGTCTLDHGELLQTYIDIDNKITSAILLGRKLICGYGSGDVRCFPIFDNCWKELHLKSHRIRFKANESILAYLLNRSHDLKCQYIKCIYQATNAADLKSHLETHLS